MEDLLERWAKVQKLYNTGTTSGLFSSVEASDSPEATEGAMKLYFHRSGDETVLEINCGEFSEQAFNKFVGMVSKLTKI